MKVLFEKDNFVYDENLILSISNECGILKDTARLLIHRNIDSVEKAKIFLSPSKKYFYDPYLLNGVDKAVERIKEARSRGESILVFGDYDADGVCATTVLYSSLTNFGIKTNAVIPEREDGYGLNVEMIKKIVSKNKIDLIITVDCGVSDFEKIEEIKGLGIDIIVTDHHEPPEILPNCIVINPKVKGQDYPFTGLCGAGVAYKLAVALIGEKANEYLDIVALATVADSMDLIDENRNIVYEGLKIFNSNKLRSCIKYCLGENLNKPITAQTLAFTLAPRINAGGRMGDANSSLNLFLEDDENERFNLAVRLNTYNIERQVECDEIYNQAKSIIKEKKIYNDKAILIYNESWKSGFVGIVASKLVEEYNRPVIVFAGYDGYLKGSARSVDEVNIYEALSSVEQFLITFGGHSQAAGISLEKKNFSAFKKFFLTYLSNQTYAHAKEKEIKVEWEIEGELDKRFAKEIELLEPFGVGNKRPVFSTKVKNIYSSPIKPNSPHCSFNSPVIEMMDFNGVKNIDILALPINKQLIFETNVSTFKNKEYVKGYLKNIVADYSEIESVYPEVFIKELKNVVTFETKIQLDKTEENFNIATLYVANVGVDYNKYKDLPLYLFNKDDRLTNNCVIVCPKEIPSGYERIIYLGNPLYTFEFNGDSFVEKSSNYIINGLSTDRNSMIAVFNVLKSMVNCEFDELKSFYKQTEIKNIYQYLFSEQVFFELGFFAVNNGLLKNNKEIKKQLEESKIYTKILEIKENV